MYGGDLVVLWRQNGYCFFAENLVVGIPCVDCVVLMDTFSYIASSLFIWFVFLSL